jgi:cytochrome c oxidase subunit 3
MLIGPSQIRHFSENCLFFFAMSQLTRSNFQAHPFHLVSPSPWPLYTCISLLTLTTSAVSTFHGFNQADYILMLALISVILSMSFWWRDVISEGTYLGNHTLAVQRGLNMGVALFIVSEALFFLAIFWAFFHSALSPTVELGAQWPPMGIDAINPFELPLLNTVILLSSGVTVTYAHHSLIQGNRSGTLYGLVATVLLAVVFTIFQGVEYTVSSFTISDGAFGSCFYFGTGFHGIHVMIGTAFIAVGLWRVLAYHQTENHHLGLESSILYWHFVDVVWLFLFVSIYYWGS